MIRNEAKSRKKADDLFFRDTAALLCMYEAIQDLESPVTGHNQFVSGASAIQQGFGGRCALLFEAPGEGTDASTTKLGT